MTNAKSHVEMVIGAAEGFFNGSDSSMVYQHLKNNNSGMTI